MNEVHQLAITILGEASMSDLSIPANQVTAVTIGNRYRVTDKLGQGGMGVVFRADDRLTGQKVALKQVVVAATELEFTTDGAASDSQEALLGLVTEFRTLSGLRHPNIISVLDYGFEIAPDTGESHPYFTMTLIEEAETVATYTESRDLSVKIGVLIQVLQALAYLHRRGILHRDLKPGNVLVTPQGQVKVLDFGLALATNSDTQQKGEVMGTLAYMAPEVLWGKSTTAATDLYAVGVMAYELITGSNPYGDSPGQMVMNILNMAADLSRIPDEAIQEVVGRLLEKEPLDRYENAGEVIAAFSAATGIPLPPESMAIRESFLQAADFVGRDEEIYRLRQALKTIVAARQGASFLIGGESGVGKSRLVDEVRTLALIEGAAVLRGQGVAGGGLPYQLWREPMRRLALMVELSDLEAAILHEIVPDMPELLERSIPPAPRVDAKSGQQRLISTIVEVIHRVTHPVMLLVEDLQWAQESLEPLKQLNAVAKDFPLLIVGTFRDDERPNLPDELSNMELIKLARLSKHQIAALSYSMLGTAGQRPEVIELLQRETEGNAFFAVEVVRALAEDVERLGDIGTKTLPASVFAQGIQSVIQRRLERVPEAGRDLLRLAAVMGRDLDLEVLQVLEAVDLDAWLRACSDAAVLEVVDDRWRFAHEKLREGLLNAPNQADFHRRVAEAIEQVHLDELAPYYGDLARHHQITGDLQKERHYARLAGEAAVERYANNEALVFLNRALELTPDMALLARFSILLTREKIYIAQGARELREQDVQTLITLSNSLGAEQKAWAQERLANYHLDTGDYPATIAAAEQAIQLAKEISHQQVEINAVAALGGALWRTGNYDEARPHFEHLMELADTLNLPETRAMGLRQLGILADLQGNWQTSYTFFSQSLDIQRELGNLANIASALANVGIPLWRQARHAEARAMFEEALAMRQRINDRAGMTNVYGNLAMVMKAQGDYYTCNEYNQKALELARESGNRYYECRLLLNLGSNDLETHHYGQALPYLEEAAEISRATNDRQNECFCYNNLCLAYRALGDFAIARQYGEKALTLSREINDRWIEVQTLDTLTRIALHEGNAELALETAEQTLTVLESMESEIDQRRFYWLQRGEALAAVGRLDEAESEFQRAAEGYAKDDDLLKMLTAMGLARVAMTRGNLMAAMLHILPFVDEIIAKYPLYVAHEPVKVYWTAYQVLQAVEDYRADEILNAGYNLLEMILDSAGNEDKRRSTLENIPAHRDLMAAWNAAQ